MLRGVMYSLSAIANAVWSLVAIGSRTVTVTTNNDKTGYALVANGVDSGQFTQAAADKVWSTAARTLTAFGFSVTVGTNNDKTGYSLSAGSSTVCIQNIQHVSGNIDCSQTGVNVGISAVASTAKAFNSQAGGQQGGAGAVGVAQLTSTSNTHIDGAPGSVTGAKAYYTDVVEFK